jgi:hypothetical protein
MFSLQFSNFEVLLYASKIYKFGLQLCTKKFLIFKLLGSIFLPFVQSNKLDLQCMDIAKDRIEMLQCMVYLKVFTKMKSKTLKFEKPHPKLKLTIPNYNHRCAPLWPSDIRLISLWAKFTR